MTKLTLFHCFTTSWLVFTIISGMFAFSAQAAEKCSIVNRQQWKHRMVRLEKRQQVFQKQLENLDFEKVMYILNHRMAAAGITRLRSVS